MQAIQTVRAPAAPLKPEQYSSALSKSSIATLQRRDAQIWSRPAYVSRSLSDMVQHDAVQFSKLLPPPEACVLLDKAEREEHAKLGAYAKRRKLEAAVKADYDNASLQEQVFNLAGVSSDALPQFLRPGRVRVR